jgi:hypothetical protein
MVIDHLLRDRPFPRTGGVLQRKLAALMAYARLSGPAIIDKWRQFA